MSPLIPKIGVLAVSEAESIDAFTDALTELGWIAGRDYTLFMPAPSSDDEKLAANMKTLLEAGMTLVVAQTKPAARVAVKMAREVPVVLGAFNGDPEQEGIVSSLEQPGGNVTGTYYLGQAGAEKRCTLLMELAPHVRRIGVLMNPRSAFSRELGFEAVSIAHRMGLNASEIGAAEPALVEPAFADAKAKGIEAIVTVTGADMYALREAIANAAWQQRMPAVMGSIGFAELGGLAKLGPDIPVLWRQMAAAHVVPILQGESPSHLPMIGLDKFELDINLVTAAHLDLVVSEDLRGRANKLIHIADPKGLSQKNDTATTPSTH